MRIRLEHFPGSGTARLEILGFGRLQRNSMAPGDRSFTRVPTPRVGRSARHSLAPTLCHSAIDVPRRGPLPTEDPSLAKPRLYCFDFSPTAPARQRDARVQGARRREQAGTLPQDLSRPRRARPRAGRHGGAVPGAGAVAGRYRHRALHPGAWRSGPCCSAIRASGATRTWPPTAPGSKPIRFCARPSTTSPGTRSKASSG